MPIKYTPQHFEQEPVKRHPMWLPSSIQYPAYKYPGLCSHTCWCIHHPIVTRWRRRRAERRQSASSATTPTSSSSWCTGHQGCESSPRFKGEMERRYPGRPRAVKTYKVQPASRSLCAFRLRYGVVPVRKMKELSTQAPGETYQVLSKCAAAYTGARNVTSPCCTCSGMCKHLQLLLKHLDVVSCSCTVEDMQWRMLQLQQCRHFMHELL